MSPYQYGTLRGIAHYEITVEKLQGLNMTTIRSLIIRGWVERSGNQLVITKAGDDALLSYQRAGINKRKYEAPVSESVKALLHLNKLVQIRKSA